ncbi:17993_t:CDS:2 [Dentiscutata erythropus]|uniref:17993_t:CDS:1 n=1 Tax=Dentiscutata erythropus TaxID=1348616 RepID=A0A9N8V6Z5_9GLOM|nr:17993_t:CDS:2 [Dentiscutata erythropus]
MDKCTAITDCQTSADKDHNTGFDKDSETAITKNKRKRSLTDRKTCVVERCYQNEIGVNKDKKWQEINEIFESKASQIEEARFEIILVQSGCERMIQNGPY